MKIVIFLQSLAFSAVLSCVGCAHTPKSSSVDFAPLSGGLDKIEGHLNAIERAKPEEVRPIVRVAKGDVLTMRGQLAVAKQETDKVIGQRDWWQKDSLDTKEELKKEKIATHRYQAKLRLIGLVLAGVSALLAFSLLAHLSAYLTAVAPAAMPYFLALRLGLSGLVFASVFSWVRYW